MIVRLVEETISCAFQLLSANNNPGAEDLFLNLERITSIPYIFLSREPGLITFVDHSLVKITVAEISFSDLRHRGPILPEFVLAFI